MALYCFTHQINYGGSECPRCVEELERKREEAKVRRKRVKDLANLIIGIIMMGTFIFLTFGVWLYAQLLYLEEFVNPEEFGLLRSALIVGTLLLIWNYFGRGTGGEKNKKT